MNIGKRIYEGSMKGFTLYTPVEYDRFCRSLERYAKGAAYLWFAITIARYLVLRHTDAITLLYYSAGVLVFWLMEAMLTYNALEQGHFKKHELY